MKDKTIYGISHATDGNSISSTWIAQRKHASSKKSTLAGGPTVVQDHFGLSIRPLYLEVRARTVPDKAKGKGREEILHHHKLIKINVCAERDNVTGIDSSGAYHR